MSYFKTVTVALGLCALAITATGCGGAQLTPSPMPTIADVRALQAQTATVPAAAVPDFYTTGLTLVQMRCGDFFDQAVMSSLRSAQTMGQVQLLSGLLSGVMGLAGAGGPMTAGAGLGVSTLAGLLGNQEGTSLAGSHPAAMSTLTRSAQQALIAALAEPKTAADAWASLYSVAQACSPAGIQSLKEDALRTAPDRLGVSGGAGRAMRSVRVR
jgi:hypothetical protein